MYDLPWEAYFRFCEECGVHLRKLDEWIRRKQHCMPLKQRRRAKATAAILQSLGIPE